MESWNHLLTHLNYVNKFSFEIVQWNRAAQQKWHHDGSEQWNEQREVNKVYCDLNALSHKRLWDNLNVPLNCITLFYYYYSGFCSDEATELVPLTQVVGHDICSLFRAQAFAVNLLMICPERYRKNSLFSRTFRWWHTLLVDVVFPITYWCRAILNKLSQILFPLLLVSLQHTAYVWFSPWVLVQVKNKSLITHNFWKKTLGFKLLPTFSFMFYGWTTLWLFNADILNFTLL